jgi:hypothetical protein
MCSHHWASTFISRTFALLLLPVFPFSITPDPLELEPLILSG